MLAEAYSIHRKLLLCAALVFPLQGHAASLLQGGVTGFFSNAEMQDGDFMSISNKDKGRSPVGAAVFQWGTATVEKPCGKKHDKRCNAVPLQRHGRSEIYFDGVGSDKGETGYKARPGQVFLLGKFGYTNRAASFSDGMTGVDLVLDLGVQGLGGKQPSYHISIDNTEDAPKPSPDKLSLGIGAAPFLFKVDGQQYAFSLLGFSSDHAQSFKSTLVVRENGFAKVGLYGRFDPVASGTNPTPVPIPAAGGLLSLGLLGMSAMARKAGKNA